MAETTNFSRLNIMVVDDETFMRSLIARTLMEIGVNDVITARDGVEALKKLDSGEPPPYIIICDLEMPEMDGIAFVRHLRSHARAALQYITVLILTGHAEPENVYGAIDRGIHGYLVKPISRNALESRVAAALTEKPIDPIQIKR